MNGEMDINSTLEEPTNETVLPNPLVDGCQVAELQTADINGVLLQSQMETTNYLKRPHSSREDSSSSSSTSALTTSETPFSYGDDTPVVKKAKIEVRPHMFDMNYAGSPREFRRLRTDLLEHQNNVRNLEDRIQQMHNVRKGMETMFDNETKSLRRQHELDRKTIAGLETRVDTLREREAELIQELSKLKDEYMRQKIRRDEDVEVLEKSLSKIKEDSLIGDAEEKQVKSDLKRDLREMMARMQAAEEDAIVQKKLVETLEEQLLSKVSLEQELNTTKQTLQSTKTKLMELENSKENYLEFQEQAKLQMQKLVHYSEMERETKLLKEENIRLKDAVRNKLLLEEEVHNLKHRFNNYKKQEKKLADLQAEHNQMSVQLNEWRTVAHQICETNGPDVVLPHLLRSVYERQQQQEISLTSTKMDLESQLSAAHYDAKIAKSNLEQCNNLLADVQRTSEQKQMLIHRLQKKNKLVCRERDSYRSQLDSYEKDLTMCISASQTSSQVQCLKDRIDNMQGIIDNYKDVNAQLESDLHNYQANLYAEGERSKSEQLIQLQNDIQQLKIANEILTQRKDVLEQRLEKYSSGATDSNLQINHQTVSPVSQCLADQAKLNSKLEQEVDRLRRKVKSLEDGLETSKLNESVCPQTLKTLREQVNASEAQVQKMKDCFKMSMHEFRNVVYMLLGYRIDRSPNSIYKLVSVYADRAEDQLCFQLSTNGTLNLLENHYSIAVDDLVTLHLKHQNSIPVFLSAHTVELFNNRSVT